MRIFPALLTIKQAEVIKGETPKLNLATNNHLTFKSHRTPLTTKYN